MEISYVENSFMRLTGETTVTKGLHGSVEELVAQLDVKNAVDHVVFQHVDYGDDIRVYLRRLQDGYIISLEDKDFAVETA